MNSKLVFHQGKQTDRQTDRQEITAVTGQQAGTELLVGHLTHSCSEAGMVEASTWDSCWG